MMMVFAPVPCCWLVWVSSKVCVWPGTTVPVLGASSTGDAEFPKQQTFPFQFLLKGPAWE